MANKAEGLIRLIVISTILAGMAVAFAMFHSTPAHLTITTVSTLLAYNTPKIARCLYNLR